MNETLDVNDGGVSGVAHGDVMEFAPGATPKIVETGRICGAPRRIAEALLQTVYGFRPAVPEDPNLRVEFSVHPARQGFACEHTIIWEIHDIPAKPLPVAPQWPNRFSRLLGDKVFGLLIADAYGLAIPRTTVLSRNLMPFTFGKPTGSEVRWLRTAPEIPEPGLSPTVRGWTDPFKLMDVMPGHEPIPSVLIQDEVPAKFSGAILTGNDARPIVEGVVGFGDKFMLGYAAPTDLDRDLVRRLEELHETLIHSTGSLRAEWVFDGNTIWTIQLQQVTALSSGRIIVPGMARSEVEFEAAGGLPALRSLIAQIEGTEIGMRIKGDIGMTSHIADLLRRHGIPSRIASE